MEAEGEARAGRRIPRLLLLLLFALAATPGSLWLVRTVRRAAMRTRLEALRDAGPPRSVLASLDGILSGAAFVRVEAGEFRMGSNRGEPDEQPPHRVRITHPFLLQRTEVTQAQWRAVTGENPASHANCGDDCPVERVTWNEVQAFLRRLNEMDPGKGYRLPTEAEWEYAARAGGGGAVGGTGVLDEMAWHVGNSGGTTHPVATRLPNAWGLYDTQGNVWEWVQDLWGRGYYAESPADDPTGPADGTPRVLRGGGYGAGVFAIRLSYRLYDIPSYRGERTGFRIARSP